MTITCEAMGYSCGYEVSGDSLDAILDDVKDHSFEFHGYSREELEMPEKLEAWKGAIKQASLPPNLRTPREEDHDVVPH